ncbi:MAG: winged helix-turn-helix domain-containing protein [Acidobacteriota bacterium]|nr:winged helix-turn-helix domain-containing protein [Acidobacteriota bacterium]
MSIRPLNETNGSNGTKDFRLAECLVQPQLNRVTREGETTQIEPKMMRVLVCLAERAEQVVTREELLEKVWGDVYVSEQVLSRSISELRKVLADDAKTIIETIPKTGYRLIAPVVYEPLKSNGYAIAETAAAPPAIETAPPKTEPRESKTVLADRRVWLAALLLAGLTTVVAWRWFATAPAGSLPVMRVSLNLAEVIPSELDVFQSLAISPDGRRLAYVARREGRYQIFLRALDQSESVPVPGTEGGLGPFFSPDGEWIGFYGDGTLKKVAVGGGVPLIIGGEVSDPGGASWSEDGSIIYVRRFFEGLSRIPASGGKPERLTTLNTERGDRSHFWPEVLPGGETVLFTIWLGGNPNDSLIASQSLKTGEQKILLKGASHARYLPTGHLALARGGVLRVVPFDLQRLTVTGQMVKTTEFVAMSQISGAAHFVCSRNGLLVYIPAPPANAGLEMVRVDRQGQAQPLFRKAENFWTPRLSADGKRLAVGIPDNALDLWVYEIGGDAFKRLTFGHLNLAPLWTPDARRIVFSSDQNGALNLYWKAADGSGEVERLTQSRNLQFAHSWTPDGRTLIYAEIDAETRWDVWTLDVSQPVESRRPRPLLKTGLDEAQPALSPDGRWLAYAAKEFGKWQIYVQPYPALDGKWQISTEGGFEPLWSQSGKELFFRFGDRLMTVEIEAVAGFKASKPQVVFTGDYKLESVSMLPTYAVAPDGQSFLMLRKPGQSSQTKLNLVLGWFDDLKRNFAKPTP